MNSIGCEFTLCCLSSLNRIAVILLFLDHLINISIFKKKYNMARQTVEQMDLLLQSPDQVAFVKKKTILK